MPVHFSPPEPRGRGCLRTCHLGQRGTAGISGHRRPRARSAGGASARGRGRPGHEALRDAREWSLIGLPRAPERRRMVAPTLSLRRMRSSSSALIWCRSGRWNRRRKWYCGTCVLAPRTPRSADGASNASAGPLQRAVRRSPRRTTLREDQESCRRHQVRTRYLFAAVSSIVRSLRARA